MKEDLRIQIYFATEEAPHAPEGPGWYVVATRPTSGIPEVAVQEILPRIRLNLKDVPKLAKVIDKFTEGKPLNWATDNHGDISLEQAVNEATDAGKEIIKQRLVEAEAAVQKLAELRARVEEFDD